eukprot:TRINITY_DN34128_c0_g1_i1.p1 TRINITY_DN34128_c0_g1~~TRINITY_DN34128_c0_g1_i1.p1  ORF type:complete len:216 (+),score=49.32 TRINITY_DN34128_c0_g1_i1:83-730(+)
MAVWPAANMSDWPGTRIGALVFDAVVICLVAAVVLRVISLKAALDREMHSAGDALLAAGHRRGFGVAVTGTDLLRVGDSQDTLLLQQERCCPPCGAARTIPAAEVRSVDAVRGRSIGVCCVLQAFVLGCVAGLFLHFIPCLWWTCDWGDSDGEGVRGAIWFATWGLTFPGLLLTQACTRDYVRVTLAEGAPVYAAAPHSESAAAAARGALSLPPR